MSDPEANPSHTTRRFQPKAAIVALAFVALTMLGMVMVSPLGLFVALRDGAPAIAICICATGLGLWIVKAIGLRDIPLRWNLLLSCVLGLGTISLLVLALGLAGVLQQGVWLALLLVCLGLGVWRCWRLRKRGAFSLTSDSNEEDGAGLRLLWLVAVPFLVLAFLGATLPPGIFWPAEGNGYDVLEYHLGVPREFLDAGAITYLPHNIYSNFPFAVEMLYLLSMVLHGNALAGVFTAKLLNVALGVLAVGAVWLAGREFGRRVGIIAGVCSLSVPILTYLSVVAYVENGMLAFTAMATAAAIRAFRETRDVRWRWSLVAGLCAGFACGCKYTAVPMVVLPLFAATLTASFRDRGRGLIAPIVFLLGVLVTFGPWLVKNTVYTGNPVFPLARGVFHERDGIWDDERAEHWHDGHLPAPEDRPLGRRLTRLWREVVGTGLLPPHEAERPGAPNNQALLGSALYGPIPLLVIVGGLGAAILSRRRRRDCAQGGRGVVVAWIVLAAVLVTWTAFTHLAGRFAIPLIVPVAIIAGWLFRFVQGRANWRAIGICVVLAVAACNYSTIYRVFNPPEMPYLSLGLSGRLDVMLGENSPHPHLPALNERLKAGHRILVVADARRLYLEPGADYCVVFNRNPFAEAAASLTPHELMAWLRERGYDYVYVDWAEMARLRRSRYGFWPSVTVALFQTLMDHGLVLEDEFRAYGMNRPYGTLFRVPASQ